MSYILYAASARELKSVPNPESVIVCEIWSQLPRQYDFVEVKDSNGKKAMIAEDEHEGLYIWVPSSTVEALTSTTILWALGYPRREKYVNFFNVQPKPAGTLDGDFVTSARSFNAQQLTKASARKIDKK